MGLKRQNDSSTEAAAPGQAEFYSETSLLIQHATGRDLLLIKLLIATGLNPSELVNLQVRDLYEEFIRIRQENTRNDVSRNIPVSQRLLRQLHVQARGKKPQDYVFSTRQSPKLTTRRVEQIFLDASKKAGLHAPITPRDCRNAFLVQAAKSASNDQELKNLTGLKSISKKATLSQDEQKRLITAAQSASRRDLALLTLLLDSGISLSEAIALKKKELARNSLLLQRGTIPITATTYQLLNNLAKDTAAEEYLFTSRQSAQLTLRRAEQLVSDIAFRAGLTQMTSHTLKATAIERIAQQKGVVVAQQHAGLKSSLRYLYGHVDKNGVNPGGAP